MDRQRFVQKGAARLDIEKHVKTREFYFVLLPKLTMLAFSAAVEPLRIANQLTKTELYRWYTMTPDGSPVTCSNGIKIIPDMALKPPPQGAISFICSGVQPLTAAGPETINWLRRENRMGATLGGICTGAFALAQAGIIGDRSFTVHWENQPSFVENFQNCLPTQNLYEKDGKLITCGGGSASTDMMLDLIETDYGREIAVVISDMCIHKRASERRAPQKSSLSVAIGSRNQRLLQAIQVMNETIEDPLPLLELCATLQISRRQLERLFKKYTQQSPTKFYYSLRLERAHGLLNETNLPITEIAMATGFKSTSHLARHFKVKFGASPKAFRKGWKTDHFADVISPNKK